MTDIPTAHRRATAVLDEVGPVRFLHDPIGDKTKSKDGVGPELRDLLGRYGDDDPDGEPLAATILVYPSSSGAR